MRAFHGNSQRLKKVRVAIACALLLTILPTLNGRAQSASWGLDRIDQRALPLDGVFVRLPAELPVTVYVVDTGVRADHEELIERVSAGVNVSSDRQGSTDASDCHGHGTFVSAIVAGRSLGVSNNARIVPVRAFGCKANGWASEIVHGIRWVIEQHPVGTPGVINLSLSMPASSQIDLAVTAALDAGLVVVSAAGNSSVDSCTTSPGRVPGVINVAASQQDDAVLSMSNHGRCVDLYAPGVWVTSAWAGSPTERRSLKGTSFAAPHVAAIAVELLSRTPSLSPTQVHEAIVSGATRGVLTSVPANSPNLLAYLAPVNVPPPTTTVPPTTVPPTTTVPMTTVPPTTVPTTTVPTVTSQVVANRACCGRWHIVVTGVRPFEEFAVRAVNSSRRPVQSISWLVTADEKGSAMFFVPGAFDRHQFSLSR